MGNFGMGKMGIFGMGKMGNFGMGKMGIFGMGKMGNFGMGKMGNFGMGKMGNFGSAVIVIRADVKLAVGGDVPWFRFHSTLHPCFLAPAGIQTLP